MKSRKIQTTRKPLIKREREQVSLKYIAIASVCGIILAAGFFGAARQHFASINYGINNSKLKKQVDELKSEQRRLQLSKEIALSPAEIKKSAKRIGFTEMTANNIQTFSAEKTAVELSEKPETENPKIIEAKLDDSASENEKSIKTKVVKPEIGDFRGERLKKLRETEDKAKM